MQYVYINGRIDEKIVPRPTLRETALIAIAAAKPGTTVEVLTQPKPRLADSNITYNNRGIKK